jgi:chemotaxis protein MotB
MSRKKHPEHVNHERWLVSYADFITLLFAFFVVLFASSQSDKKKQTQMAAAMQSAFSPVAAFEQHSKQPSLTESGGAAARPAVVTPPVPTPEQSAQQIAQRLAEHGAKPVPNLHELLDHLARSRGLPPGSLSMHATQEGLVISLEEGGFFNSGSAEIEATSLPVLARLAEALPPVPMRVEGHTDTIPIHTAQFATNWELSSARASAIARYLVDHSAVKASELGAAGYAEFRPVATNETPEGRAKNRRVDIVLLATPVSTTLPNPAP